jgi:cellulose synthase/poly-beta-1,6-N-acetylglucosamine synthase-like glycosyltransferase
MKEGEIRNPIGANMAFRREAFEITGFFRTEVRRYGGKTAR